MFCILVNICIDEKRKETSTYRYYLVGNQIHINLIPGGYYYNSDSHLEFGPGEL